MSQQTDLPPLTPSWSDLLGAWLRPWRLVGYVGAKVIPVLIPLGLGVWGLDSMADNIPNEAAFEAASAQAVSTGGGFFELAPVLLVMTMAVLVVMTTSRMARV